MTPGDIAVRRHQAREAHDMHLAAERHHLAREAASGARREHAARGHSFGWLNLLKMRRLIEVERMLQRKLAASLS